MADLSVDLDSHVGPRMVQRLLLRRRRAPDLLIPWAAVADFGHSGVVLSDGPEPPTPAGCSNADELHPDEILLVRDVLDSQIVDVVGQRLARVADVALTRAAADRLELVGVEVGFGGVLRRLGLSTLAARIREDVVAWTDLHLTSDRGHTVQLATPLSAVHHLDDAGLAALVDRLDIDSAAEVLGNTGPLLAARVIRATDPMVGERVLRAMTDEDVTEIVGAMPGAHAARWRTRLSRTPPHLGRGFLRSQTWPRRRRVRTDTSP